MAGGVVLLGCVGFAGYGLLKIARQLLRWWLL
jgi:hypothetical protein